MCSVEWMPPIAYRSGLAKYCKMSSKPCIQALPSTHRYSYHYRHYHCYCFQYCRCTQATRSARTITPVKPGQPPHTPHTAQLSHSHTAPPQLTPASTDPRPTHTPYRCHTTTSSCTRRHRQDGTRTAAAAQQHHHTDVHTHTATCSAHTTQHRPHATPGAGSMQWRGPSPAHSTHPH